MARLLLLACLSLCLYGIGLGQNAHLTEAKKLLEKGRYREAKTLIDQHPNKNELEEAVLISAIASYHIGDYQASIDELRKRISVGIKNPYVYKYLGLSAYALSYYQDAGFFYRSYMAALEQTSLEFNIFLQELKRIENNLTFSAKGDLGLVENMGASVNTNYDEVRPIQSPTSLNKFYFSSNREGSTGGLRNAEGLKDDKYGQYHYDMYSVEQKEANWLPVYIFNSLQNTSRSEFIQGFGDEGASIYFLKSMEANDKSLQLLVDSFSLDIDKRAFPTEIVNGFRPDIGDKDLQIYNDSLWIFSSKRKGGFGGYDLYYMRKKENAWIEPVNLGPSINSLYDDVSPNLTRGSRLLFFSSNRLEGYGGFDLFYTSYSTGKQEWNKAENLGKPINSSVDEADIFISYDGTQGIFSSNRPGGYGGKDLYIIYFKDQVIDQLEFTALPYFLEESVDIFDTSSTSPVRIVVDNTLMDSKDQVVREVINTPIYYTGENISAQGMVLLRNVRDYLKIYPQLKVTLLVSSNNVSLPEFDLFQTVKMGEKAAAILTQDGVVQEDRINIIGLGSNFPLVKFDEVNISERYNNRIKVIYHNPYKDLLKILEEDIVVNSILLDGRYQKADSTLMNFGYVVSFAETNQMLRSDIVKTDRRTFIKKDLGSQINVYHLGFFSSYAQARVAKNMLLRQNLLSTKIRPYLKGKPITDDQYPSLEAVYEDLAEYLKYEGK